MEEAQERARAPKVRQVLPADGWYAGFSTGSGKLYTRRLVCWALVDTPGRDDVSEVHPWSEQTVTGMVVEDGYAVQVAFVDSGFLGYTEAADDTEGFEEMAASYVRRMKALRGEG